MDILSIAVVLMLLVGVAWRIYAAHCRAREQEAPEPTSVAQSNSMPVVLEEPPALPTEAPERALEPLELLLPDPEYHQAMIGQDAPAQSALDLTEQPPTPTPTPSQPEVPTIPTNQIIPGDNDRTAFDPVALQELADSIAMHGLAQPITVRPIENGWFQIVAGERRFRATQLLDWEEIPAHIRVLSDEEAASIMLLENVQRSDLNPVDEAQAYHKRMQQFNWSIADCARNANKTPQHIKNRLMLLSLIEEAQLLVRSGSLGLGYAECMSDLDGNRQIIALRYFSSVKRPNLQEYRALCSQLLENQQQECLFDMSAFMQAVDDNRLEATLERANRRYPTNERIPQPPKAKTLGQYFEQYIADLQNHGFPESLAAAEVVGTVYDGAKKNGLAKPPKDSPLTQREVSA